MLPKLAMARTNWDFVLLWVKLFMTIRTIRGRHQSRLHIVACSSDMLALEGLKSYVLSICHTEA